MTPRPWPPASRTRTAGSASSGRTGSSPALYRLRFHTGAYFAATGTTAFYPEVSISFEVTDDEHYHVPLLLSPFGFSTYRGS